MDNYREGWCRRVWNKWIRNVYVWMTERLMWMMMYGWIAMWMVLCEKICEKAVWMTTWSLILKGGVDEYVWINK